jgi:hypothetical protein
MSLEISSSPQLQGSRSEVSFNGLQRAADTLLRQGIKPSVAAVREALGGGSPNALTPLLARYWRALGERLYAGPDSLERVPDPLARVTEWLWQRALEEARERVAVLPVAPVTPATLLEDQLAKLTTALGEARAREGEQLSHLAALSREAESLRLERSKLVALLKGAQALLAQQIDRVAALESATAIRVTYRGPTRKIKKKATTSRGAHGANVLPVAARKSNRRGRASRRSTKRR